MTLSIRPYCNRLLSGHKVIALGIPRNDFHIGLPVLSARIRFMRFLMTSRIDRSVNRHIGGLSLGAGQRADES